MQQPFTTWLRSLLLTLALGAGTTAWGQTYSTVPLTSGSFTADIVANGPAAVLPSTVTTADADGSGYFLMSQDYYTATTAHTSGLPNSGAIANTLAGPAALTYQLASFSANNSLRLAGATAGTLTFATPRPAAEVYVLGFSGTGSSTANVTVTYADGTSTTFAAQSYPDWYDVVADRNVFGSTGRASNTVPVSTPYAAANTAPYLTQLKLTLPGNKVNTNISSLTFTKTSTVGVLNLMAVSVGVLPLCTAPPTTLQAVASTTAAGGTALTTACPGTSIYLSVSGVPASAAGYTYQWQASTTSATAGFSNLSGATGSTYVATGQAAATYYRVLVACYFATGSTPTASAPVQVAQSPYSSCYCTPTYSAGGNNDYVGRVRVGTLDNNTAAAGNVSPFYHDYAGQQTGTAPTLPIPTLVLGSTANVTLNFGSDGTQYSAVWLDFDHSGTFEASEYFTQGTNAGGNGQAVIPVAVPAGALTGNTKLRVRGGDDRQPTSGQACGASDSNFGEAEDYLVNISTTAPCTPTTATFGYGAAASYCVSGPTNPAVTLASGATAGTFTSTTGLTINATTGAITLSSSTPGTYTVTNTVAATATNCASSATTTVVITAAPTAGFSYAAAAGCAGTASTKAPTLAAGATAGTYSLPAAPGLSINASTGVVVIGTTTGAGTYTVTNTVAASGGCAAVSSTATFVVSAAPATPTLTPTGTAGTGITLTSSATTGNQFYLNGVLIAGATAQTYLVNSGTKNGSYTVVVTNAAGCTATSAAVTVTVTATAPAAAGPRLTLYPTPTPDGLLTLELSGYQEPVQVSVVNTLGQRVYTTTLSGSALTQKQTLNLSNLAVGVYLLQARTASGGTQVRRFVREQ